MVNTTLKVRESTKKALDNLKIHKRETYDDIIGRLIKIVKGFTTLK